MSNPILSLYGHDGESLQPADAPFAGLVTRSKAVEMLQRDSTIDILVIGGGLTGVVMAHQAALHGARVVLVEPGYFGERSAPWRLYYEASLSSRSLTLIRDSKSLRQVSHALAPHLAGVVPSVRDRKQRLLQRLCSWWVGQAWRPADSTHLEHGVPDLDERLLIREVALAARQEGAIALTGGEVLAAERDGDDDRYTVTVLDRVLGKELEVSVRYVFVDPASSQPMVDHSGAPLVPVQSTRHPFVTGVFSVTRRSGIAETDNFSSRDAEGFVHEVAPGVVEASVILSCFDTEEESLKNKVRDLCVSAGWEIIEEISWYQHGRGYSGRTQVDEDERFITVQERGPWGAFHVAHEVLATIVPAGAILKKILERPLAGRDLSGGIADFQKQARQVGVSEVTIESVVRRWQGRVRYLASFRDGLREVCPGILLGEIGLAVVSDQVASLEDLLFGALAIQQLPKWESMVPSIAAVLESTGALPSEAILAERAIACMKDLTV